jgi:hypothetical protein
VSQYGYTLQYVKEQNPELIRVAIEETINRYEKLPENFKAIVDWDLLIMEGL